MNQVYLKPNAIAEPLIDRWHAWSYLIPPATTAMYIANSHIKIMESFVEAPQIHQAALKDPRMIGGSFINYDPSRVAEIADLLAKTKEEQASLLELAAAIQELSKILAERGNGYSLEPLYQEVPEALKGYVELVYNRHDNPEIRFIEGLLYSNPNYQSAKQSITLSLINEDSRSFVFSTPRLPEDRALDLNFRFNYSGWDRLFKMRYKPDSYEEIKELFKIASDRESLFSSFFTETPPKSINKYNGDRVRVRYFGHACILIETETITILCDPLISYQQSDTSNIPRYTYEDLPEIIDYVLITHNHQDHVMFETLLQLRHKIRNVIVPKGNKGSLIDPSLKLIFEAIGFKNVREIDDLEKIEIAEDYILGLPVLGEHGDLNIASKTAYCLNIKGQKILCASDSNNIEPMLYKNLHRLLGDVDLIFIGMECDGAPYNWAYGSLLTQSIPRKISETRRLNGSDAQKAINLINRFNPQQAYIYAMGQEPWLTYITSIKYTDRSRPIIESDRVVEFCLQHGIHSELLYGCQEIILESKSNPQYCDRFLVETPVNNRKFV